jgi:hypothetical protein
MKSVTCNSTTGPLRNARPLAGGLHLAAFLAALFQGLFLHAKVRPEHAGGALAGDLAGVLSPAQALQFGHAVGLEHERGHRVAGPCRAVPTLPRAKDVLDGRESDRNDPGRAVRLEQVAQDRDAPLLNQESGLLRCAAPSDSACDPRRTTADVRIRVGEAPYEKRDEIVVDNLLNVRPVSACDGMDDSPDRALDHIIRRRQQISEDGKRVVFEDRLRMLVVCEGNTENGASSSSLSKKQTTGQVGEAEERSGDEQNALRANATAL